MRIDEAAHSLNTIRRQYLNRFHSKWVCSVLIVDLLGFSGLGHWPAYMYILCVSLILLWCETIHKYDYDVWKWLDIQSPLVKNCYLLAWISSVQIASHCWSIKTKKMTHLLPALHPNLPYFTKTWGFPVLQTTSINEHTKYNPETKISPLSSDNATKLYYTHFFSIL